MHPFEAGQPAALEELIAVHREFEKFGKIIGMHRSTCITKHPRHCPDQLGFSQAHHEPKTYGVRMR